MSGALRAPALHMFCVLRVPVNRTFCGLCDSIRRTADLPHNRIRCRCDCSSLIEVRAKKWNSFYDLHYDFAITICTESMQVPALSAFPLLPFPCMPRIRAHLSAFLHDPCADVGKRLFLPVPRKHAQQELKLFLRFRMNLHVIAPLHVIGKR